MKRKLFFVALVLLGAFVFAQAKPVVAVASFDVISGVTVDEASMITDVFFVRLGNAQKVNLVNRTIVQRIIKEHNFQMEDWSDEQKTAELGKALNADWLVQGNIRKMNNGILVIVQFYDIRTFSFQGGTDLRLTNADEAYDKMDQLVEKLLQTIASTPAPAPVYKIGDRGPGGGFIFFAEGNVFMECSMDIGSYNWDNAVKVAKNYKGGGFNDWRLPTRGELDLMYQNLFQKRVGGLTGTYWSSAEFDYEKAYGRFMGNDEVGARLKTRSLAVRAVRAF